MQSFKIRNGLIVLGLLIIALAIVIVSFLSVKVNVNKEATGSGAVRVSIGNVSGRSLAPSGTLAFDVNLTSTQLKQVRVAGVDISFDTNVFSVQFVTCSNNFPSTAKATSSGNKITLSCFRPAGAAFTLNPNQASILGTVRLQVKPGAPGGTTNISFSRTKIPEAGTSADISDGGAGISVTISGSGACSLKSSGDANCDGRIDIRDFSAWRNEFLNRSGLASDFNQSGTVDVRDFMLWRGGFLNSFRY